MSRAGLLQARRGVEGGSVVVLPLSHERYATEQQWFACYYRQPFRHHDSGGGGDASMRKKYLA